jgi:sulfatase maturation enzyme AslB (radical SAM superfamily)
VTNATLLKDSVYDLLSKFKQLDVMVSIEGIGGHNDYVRYGSKWEIIDANIQRLNTLNNIEYFNIGYILQHYSYY